MLWRIVRRHPLQGHSEVGPHLVELHSSAPPPAVRRGMARTVSVAHMPNCQFAAQLPPQHSARQLEALPGFAGAHVLLHLPHWQVESAPRLVLAVKPKHLCRCRRSQWIPSCRRLAQMQALMPVTSRPQLPLRQLPRRRWSHLSQVCARAYLMHENFKHPKYITITLWFIEGILSVCHAMTYWLPSWHVQHLISCHRWQLVDWAFLPLRPLRAVLCPLPSFCGVSSSPLGRRISPTCSDTGWSWQGFCNYHLTFNHTICSI